MTTAARDRLAKMLLGTRAGTFSVGFTTQPDDLNLTVDGLGDIDFPIRPAAARSLISLAHPARFGRGEQTLTDPAVRDTWEVPKHLVSARWDEDILRIVRKAIQVELGMPESAELTLDLHSLLVYEPGQFFLPHQDSEKNDAMVGTLVVTLPSVYTGGELVVRHLDAEERYKGTKSELSLVAFYADCRHEVLAVETGYRIALTYNLLLRGDKTVRDDSRAETVAELAALLREHFTTPAGGYGTRASLPPDRLVYLLDHEYSPAALRWPGLKGDDARRVSLLRAAAERENAEAVLALADIKTTHDAFEADDYYGKPPPLLGRRGRGRRRRLRGRRSDRRGGHAHPLDAARQRRAGDNLAARRRQRGVRVHPDRRLRALRVELRRVPGQLGQHARPAVQPGRGGLLAA